jgi:hypothetical protein
METQQYAIVFHREALRHFRAECVRRDTTPTKELNRLLEEQLAQWTGVVQLEEFGDLSCEPIDVEDCLVRLTIAEQKPSATLSAVGAKAVITWLGRVVAQHEHTRRDDRTSPSPAHRRQHA